MLPTATTDTARAAYAANVICTCVLDTRRHLVFVMRNGDVFRGFVRGTSSETKSGPDHIFSGIIIVEDETGDLRQIDALEVTGVMPA